MTHVPGKGVPGGYTTEWTTAKDNCPKCAGSGVVYKLWESSDGAYDDYHFRCNDCGHDWWVDGPDA